MAEPTDHAFMVALWFRCNLSGHNCVRPRTPCLPCSGEDQAVPMLDPLARGLDADVETVIGAKVRAIAIAPAGAVPPDPQPIAGTSGAGHPRGFGSLRVRGSARSTPGAGPA